MTSIQTIEYQSKYQINIHAHTSFSVHKFLLSGRSKHNDTCWIESVTNDGVWSSLGGHWSTNWWDHRRVLSTPELTPAHYNDHLHKNRKKREKKTIIVTLFLPFPGRQRWRPSTRASAGTQALPNTYFYPTFHTFRLDSTLFNFKVHQQIDEDE